MTPVNEHDLEVRLQTAASAARRAGRLALSMGKSIGDLGVQAKSIQDYVTDADLAAEDRIRETLLTEFPDDSFIGEETGSLNNTNNMTWIVDPIDGTANYIRGLPGWGISIAMTAGHTPTLGLRTSPDARYSGILWRAWTPTPHFLSEA